MILLKALLTLIAIPIVLGMAVILLYVGMMVSIFMFLCVEDFIMDKFSGKSKK